MTIKDIKKLALASYSKEVLDEEKVLKISKLLNKKNLRQYVKALRLIEAKNTVKVSVAGKTDIQFKKNLESIFNKKIVIKEDNNLIAGIKIQDFDNIYEFNIKNTIENLKTYINR